MTKKTILIIVIAVCAVALIMLSIQSGPGEMSPPPLPTNMGLPPGHPAVGGMGEGVMAPEFQVRDLDGRTLRLSELKGKAVLLNFWSITCPPCRWELPSMEKLARTMAGRPFALVAVTADREKDVLRFLESNNHDLPVYLDESGNAHASYGAYGFPVSYVISPDGSIVNRIMGAADWGDQSVVDYFNGLIEKSKKPKESEKNEVPQNVDGGGHKADNKDQQGR